jgi:hypothetical protein
MGGGGSRRILLHALTSALEGGGLLASRPRRFTPGEEIPGTPWIGGWVNPRAVLDAVKKKKYPCPCWESNPGFSTLISVNALRVNVKETLK